MDAYPHRMRDLTRLTSQPAPTIHFYAQQGLLPAPLKTAGNQALYSEETVQRILWVRALQHELNLALRSIRWVLERWGELPVGEIRALQALGRLLEEPDPVATAEEVARGLAALEPTDLDELRSLGLVAPRGMPLTAHDARLIELVGALRAAGFTEAAGFCAQGLAIYRDAVERLAEEELRRVVEPALGRHAVPELHQMVVRALPLVHQLLALLHERAVQGQMQHWLEVHDPADSRTG